MTTGDQNSRPPRSMRQRRILDIAEDNPNASMEEIASKVPTVTAELVARVLEEHGDPAANDQSDGTDHEMTANDTDHGERLELTDKQRAVLELIEEAPDATQREIGERLGISAATVSNRVNGIEGFEWSDRADFVDTVLDEDPTATDSASEERAVERAGTDGSIDSDGTGESDSAETGEPDDPTDPDDRDAESGAEQANADRATDLDERNGADEAAIAELDSTVAELCERIDDLEARIESEGGTEAVTDGSPSDPSEASEEAVDFDDPKLVQKIAHACLRDENITEAEERRILRVLLS